MTDISVPCWNDVDIEELCNGVRLIAFDLDNTLARSKKPMKDDMAECFSALTSLIDVAVITGGKYALLKSQVVERLTGQANRSHLHLMPTSGTRYYRWGGSDWAPVFAHDLSADDRAKAYESLERNAREQGIWLTHVWGERIEDRGSQITFSALGQLAPIEGTSGCRRSTAFGGTAGRRQQRRYLRKKRRQVVRCSRIGRYSRHYGGADCFCGRPYGSGR